MFKKIIYLILISIFLVGCKNNKTVQENNNNNNDVENNNSIKSFTLSSQSSFTISNDRIFSIENMAKQFDSFGGRLSGSVENKESTNYLVNFLEGSNINPLNKNYLQEFEINNVTNTESSFKINLESNDTIILEYGKDYFIPSFVNSFKTTFEKENETRWVVRSKSINESELKNILENKEGLLLESSNFINDFNNSITSNLVYVSEEIYNIIQTSKIKNIQIEFISTKEIVNIANVIGKIKGNNNKKAIVISTSFDGYGSFENIQFKSMYDNYSGVGSLMYISKELVNISEATPFDFDIIIAFTNGDLQDFSGTKNLIELINSLKYKEIISINIGSIGDIRKENYYIESNSENELYNKIIKQFEIYNLESSTTTNFQKQKLFTDNNISNLYITSNKIKKSGSISDTKENIDFKKIEVISKIILQAIEGI